MFQKKLLISLYQFFEYLFILIRYFNFLKILVNKIYSYIFKKLL